MRRIRVLLADDYVLFRESLAALLETEPDFEVVGEAGDGLAAIEQALALEPDVILMDIRMPGCDGLTATRRIKRDLPGTKIVVLSGWEDHEQVFEAVLAGAQGDLSKTIHIDELMELLRETARGEAAVPTTLVERTRDEYRRLSQLARLPAVEPESLTLREQEVARLVAEGATDKQIATALKLSVFTVKSHVRNILAKLRVDSRRQIVSSAGDKGEQWEQRTIRN